MKEIYGVNAEKMKVVYNGVNKNRYKRCEERRADKAGSLRVLFVGRACKKKGLDKVMALAERNPSWEFDVVIGTAMFNTIGGALIDEIRALENCRVYESVPEPDLPSFYQRADVTVVPSRGYESLPTVILESIACGTPAVSVNAWGNPEVILAPDLMFMEDDVHDMERAIYAATRSGRELHKAYAEKSLSTEVCNLLTLITPHLELTK
jgi:glycosyltransferase involved in cell wall biosynthesis